MAQLPDDLEPRVRHVLEERLQGRALLSIDHMGTITDQDVRFVYATVHPDDQAALVVILTRAEQARQEGLSSSYQSAWDYVDGMAFLSMRVRYGEQHAPWAVFIFELPRWARGVNNIYVLKSLLLTDHPLSESSRESVRVVGTSVPLATPALAVALCARQGIRVLPIGFTERVPELAQILDFLREDGFLPGGEG